MAIKPTGDQKRAKKKKLTAKAAATRQHDLNRTTKSFPFQKLMEGGLLTADDFCKQINSRSSQPTPSVAMEHYRSRPEFAEIQLRTTELVKYHRLAYESGDTDTPLLGRMYSTIDTMKGKEVCCLSFAYESLEPRGIDLETAIRQEMASLGFSEPVVFFSGLNRVKATYQFAVIYGVDGETECYFVSSSRWHLVHDKKQFFTSIDIDCTAARLLSRSPTSIALRFAIDYLGDESSKSHQGRLTDSEVQFMQLATAGWANEVDYLSKTFSNNKAELSDKIYLDVWAKFQDRLSSLERNAAALEAKNSNLQSALSKTNALKGETLLSDQASELASTPIPLQERFAKFF